ncbi:MAG: NAD(P)-binding protein, partial [Alphaproteobacteria bacterium]|nr:NAD(P)-binding protein [Alphaproteobacteria bacterium]
MKDKQLKICVIGSGIAGMSAAWLLSKKHHVEMWEKDDRIGGHSNTVKVGKHAIDTGFIVYNEKNYPNLVALFDHLNVETAPTDMSFGVSILRPSGKRLEYAGTDLWGMLAQRQNIFNPKFWAMMKDILRFYKSAEEDCKHPEMQRLTLGQYLISKNYSDSFIRDHLLPMGAAIWSTPVDTMLEYPLLSFVRFCENHGLLQVSDRPQWRTVLGGCQTYVRALLA